MTETGKDMADIEKSLFSDMEVAVQESILTKTVVFQGEKTTLKDLLIPTRFVDFDEVIDSELLSKLDSNEDISIGKALNENVPCHYIPRRYTNHDNEELSDEQLCEMTEYRWHQTITIFAAPGSGKSTVLDHLAVTMKKRHPHLWVIKVDLNDYYDALSEFKKNNTKSVGIIDLLNSKPESKINDGLERKIFSIRQQVVLLVDGLDEVCPDFEDIMKDVMSNYKEHRCFAKVFVASSNNLSKELQRECWSQNPLLALPRNDQVNLFVKYLEHKLETQESIERSKVFVKELVETNWSENVIGTPLKLKLLAEIYENKIKWDSYYEFLTNDNSKSTRLKQISLTKLFLLFINKKYLKNELTLDENVLRNNIAKINKECSHFLYIIALENIFPKERCKLFNVYRDVTTKIPEEIEERLLEMGIVKKANGLLRFFHRTVSEFFVAECIAEELHNSSNKEFLVFFINEILTRRQFTVIRSFFDNVISSCVNSIPDDNLKELGSIVPDNTIILFELIKDGYKNIFYLIVKCLEVANLDIDYDVIRSDSKTLLQAAISSNRPDLLELLVEKGVSVNGRDNTERTALYDAVSKDNLNAVKFLVQRGAKVHCRDLSGRTPLHEAGVSSSVEVVEHLLAHGAVIDSKDRQGRTCLHESAKSGDLDKVKYLVENGADIDSTSNEGTPIFYAVRNEHIDVVKYLIAKGADLTLKDKSGASVLHEPEKPYYETKPVSKTQTQKENIFKTIKTLIESGANVDAIDNRGNTVLHSHIDDNDMKDLVELLVNGGADTGKINKSGLFPLDKAIQKGAFNTVKYLMEKGATQYRRESLFVAVSKGCLAIVKYLVENGADLNVADRNHHTPLLRAVNCRNFDMVKYLVENGADVHAETNGPWSETVLRMAINNNCGLNAVQFLEERGASTKGTLNTAAYRGNMALVKYLLAKGAVEKEIFDVGDNIELMRCFLEKGIKVNLPYLFYKSASTGNLDIIRYAVDNGVDVNYESFYKTALHEAAKHDHLHVVKFLVKRGARIDIKDVKAETPIDKAIRHRNIEIADFLERSDSKEGLEELHQKILSGYGSAYERLLLVLKHDVKINVTERPHSRLFSSWLERNCFDIAELLAKNNVEDCKTVVDVVNRFVELQEDDLLDEIFRQTDVIKGLLERGLEIDVKVMEKYDFLTKMASDDLKFVKYLVEKGVDINRRDVDGNTALHRASSFAVVKYLVRNGADVKAKNNNGTSVLQCAIENKIFDICRYLIDEGANVTTECENEHSTLYVAATKGSFTKLKYLVEKGAKLTEEDCSILHDVMKFNDLELVEYLIEIGAQVEGRDGEGRTAIYKAVEYNNLDMIKYLVTSGANVKVEDNKSVTLYQYASNKHNLDIMKYLASCGARFKRKSKK